MHAFEIVASVAGDRTPVDATAGAVRDVPLPDVVPGPLGSVAVGGVGLVAPEVLDGPALITILRELPNDAEVVILLPTAARDLPVGLVVDALSEAGVQAVDAMPVEGAGAFRVAVVGARVDGFAPVGSYLSGRPPIVPETAALRRIIAERVVEGLSLRARVAAPDTSSEVAALKAELTKTRSDLALTKKKLDGITSSRSYGLARRISKLKPRKSA